MARRNRRYLGRRGFPLEVHEAFAMIDKAESEELTYSSKLWTRRKKPTGS